MHGLTGRYCTLIGAIAVIVVLVAPVQGANITRNLMDSGYPTETVLEGKIEAGDYDKLKSFYGEISKLQFYLGSGLVNEIFLASPGGDLVEAMKIGRLVRALKLKTVIPGQFGHGIIAESSHHRLKNLKANYMCASACFFVFVAGINRTVEVADPILGIHRPYLSDRDLKTLSADQAITSANRVRTTVANYLAEMDVPAKYVDLMFTVPKEKVRWIGGADFHADLEGPIPGLKDWLAARCDKRTHVEKVIWEKLMADTRPIGQFSAAERSIYDMMHKKMSEMDYCELKALNELSGNAWLETFDPTCTIIAPEARALIVKYWDSSVCGQAK